MLLDVYGSLFYAGSRTLQARLPDPGQAERPVVVLRLRGRTMLGATAFAVLSDYAERLAAAGGRLYLSGVDPAVLEQLRRNRTVEQVHGVRMFEAGEHGRRVEPGGVSRGNQVARHAELTQVGDPGEIRSRTARPIHSRLAIDASD